MRTALPVLPKLRSSVGLYLYIWCVYVCMVRVCLCTVYALELHRSEVTAFPKQRMRCQRFTESATLNITGLTSIASIAHQKPKQNGIAERTAEEIDLNRGTRRSRCASSPPRTQRDEKALMTPYSFPVATLQPPPGSPQPAASRPLQMAPREGAEPAESRGLSPVTRGDALTHARALQLPQPERSAAAAPHCEARGGVHLGELRAVTKTRPGTVCCRSPRPDRHRAGAEPGAAPRGERGPRPTPPT